MPLQGPDGQFLYAAHDAYDLVGERIYAQEWTGRFTGSPPIPHLPLLRAQVSAGIPVPEYAAEVLAANPVEADRVQTLRHREGVVLKELMHILFSKAQSWLRDPDFRPISCGDWGEWEDETETQRHMKRLLKDDIAAVLRDGRPAPNRILIDKEGLDYALGYLTVPGEQSRLIPLEPQAAHRPAADYGTIRAEFFRRRDAG